MTHFLADRGQDIVSRDEKIMNRVSDQFGFSLVELMVTVALAVIVGMLTVPSFWEMIRNNQIATQTNLLVSSLNYARSEAISRGVPVSVCGSEDGNTCSASNNWNAGWIVFTDNNQAGAVDGSDVVLRNVSQATSDGIKIGYSNLPYIQFTSSGFMQQSYLLNSWFAKAIAENAVGVDAASVSMSAAPQEYRESRPWMNQMIWMILPGRNVFAGTTSSSGGSSGSTAGIKSSIILDPTKETLLSVCDSKRANAQGNAIIISRSGQIRMQKVICT